MYFIKLCIIYLLFLYLAFNSIYGIQGFAKVFYCIKFTNYIFTESWYNNLSEDKKNMDLSKLGSKTIGRFLSNLCISIGKNWWFLMHDLGVKVSISFIYKVSRYFFLFSLTTLSHINKMKLIILQLSRHQI